MESDGSADATLPASSGSADPDSTAATLADAGTSDRGSRPPTAHVPLLDGKRYVVREELGRGGMGRVFAADDLALGRQVAIKELLDGSPDLIARFERELALTARLQHPGIVTVHDGGRWSTGASAYVMRLVSGRSLEQRIAATTTFAERIALLPHAIAAVDAIAYAHAQNIIHRDLKPSNVMVGDFGETVVIDWGLAKDLHAHEPGPTSNQARSPSVGSSSSATVAGDVIGTPAYMPREQAEGLAVDERADVYALGALLYHLLAGRPPYQGSSQVVLARLHEGRPDPLGVLAPEVPPPLLAIVMRAMATDPGDRYPTAAALGIELKRFQSGKLVAAHQYSAWELFRRWVRRRKAVVSVATAALVVVAVIGVISVRRIVREQHQTRAALALAEANRAEASRRREDADRLVDIMMFGLYDKLLTLGRLDILGDIASAIRDHYAASETTGAVEDIRKRALARGRLGAVLQDKGKASEGLAEFRAAEALLARLATEHPEARDVAADWTRMQLWLAEALTRAGDLTAPRPLLVQVERRIAKELQATPRDITWLELRADETRTSGWAYEELGDLRAASASYQDACKAAAELVAVDPSEARQARVARCHLDLGDVLTRLGDDAGALPEYRSALALDVARRRADPDDPQRAANVAQSQTKVGGALADLGQTEEALALFRSAIDTGNDLLRRDPANASWKRMLASAHAAYATALSTPATAKTAIAETRIALTLRSEVLARDPADTALGHDVNRLRVRLAMLLEATSHEDEALLLYEKVCEIAEQELLAPGARLPTLGELLQCRGGQGRIAVERKNWPLAIRSHRAEIAAAQELAAGASATPTDHWNVVLGHESLADAFVAMGDTGQAATELEAAREVVMRHADPTDDEWKVKRESLERRLATLTRPR